MKFGNVLVWFLVFLVISCLAEETDGAIGAILSGAIAGTIANVLGPKIGELLDMGGSVVKESCIDTATSMDLVGSVVRLTQDLLSRTQQVSTRRDDFEQVKKTMIEVHTKQATKKDLQAIIKKALGSNLKLDKLNYDLKNVVSNQLELKTIAGKTFDQLNDVAGTTAEINRKVDNVLRLSERHEALQVQQLTALSQVDTQVSDANHKLDISLASIYGLDEQLGNTQNTVDEINVQMAQSNVRLGQLHEVSIDILTGVVQLNNSIHAAMYKGFDDTVVQFKELNKKLDGQLKTLGSWIESLGGKIIISMNHVDTILKKVGKQLRDAFAEVFQELVEGNTKAARECYRRIKEKLIEEKFIPGGSDKEKANLFLLMNPQYRLNNKNLQKNVMRLQKYLKGTTTGVEACWNELIAVVNPAGGLFGADNKDIFGDLHTIFSTRYPNASTWNKPGAIQQLKGMSKVRDQILVQMDDLYTWWALSEVGDTISARNNSDAVIPPSTLTIRLERLMVKYGEEVKNLKDRHNKQFSTCIAPSAQLEALSNFRIKCDRDLDDLFNGDNGKRAAGLKAGTVCTFLCLEPSFKPEPLICGPAGQWSVNETVLSETLIKCNQLSLGINDIKGYMDKFKDIVTTKMSEIEERMGKTEKKTDGMIAKLHEKCRGNDSADGLQSRPGYTIHYSALHGPATGKEAKERCARDGATLATIKNEAEYYFVLELANGNRLWLGFEVAENLSMITWADGGLVNDFVEESSILKWGVVHRKRCGYLRRETRFATTFCFHTILRYICQWKCPNEAQCPEGYSPTTGIRSRPGYFMCYSSLQEESTFGRAKENCARNGSSLVTIKDRAEYEYLRAMTTNDLWLGYVGAENKSTVVWFDDGFVMKTVEDIIEINWYTVVDKNCGCLINRNTEFATKSCGYLSNYICHLRCPINGICSVIRPIATVETPSIANTPNSTASGNASSSRISGVHDLFYKV